MSKIFFVAMSAWGSVSFAQVTAKAYVNLFPAGSFVADAKSAAGQNLKAILDDKKIILPESISIDLNTLSTGMSLRDDHAKNKYLDVKKYPAATLTEAKAENGKGTGLLQIKDKKSKVEGSYTVAPDQKSVTAEFKIKLSEYGIDDISYKGIGVEDEVKLEVKMSLAKKTITTPTDTKKKNDKK